MPFVENARIPSQEEFWSVLWPLVGGYFDTTTNFVAGVFTYNREKRVELHRPLISAGYGPHTLVRQGQWKFEQFEYDSETDRVRIIEPEFNENIHVHVDNYTCNCAAPSGNMALGRFVRNPPYTGFKGDISGPKKFGGRASMYTRLKVNLIEGERIFIGSSIGQFTQFGVSTRCMLEARDGGRVWAIGGGPFGVQSPIQYFYKGVTTGDYNPDFYDAIAPRPINFPPNQDNVIEIRSCLHDGYGVYRDDDPWQRNKIPIEGENQTLLFTGRYPGEIDSTNKYPKWNSAIVYVNGEAVFSYIGPADLIYYLNPVQPTIYSNLGVSVPTFFPGNPTLPDWYNTENGWINERKGAGSKIWEGAHYILDYEINGPTLDETPLLKTMADPYPESGYEICEFTKPHNERRFFIDTIGSSDIVCRPQRFAQDTPSTFKKDGAYYTILGSFEKPNFKSYGSFPQIDGYIDFYFYQLAMEGAKGVVNFDIYWRNNSLVDPENPYAGFNRYFLDNDSANIVWDDWGPSPSGTRTGKLYFPQAMPAGTVADGIYQLYFGTQKSVNVTLSR